MKTYYLSYKYRGIVLIIHVTIARNMEEANVIGRAQLLETFRSIDGRELIWHAANSSEKESVYSGQIRWGIARSPSTSRGGRGG